MASDPRDDSPLTPSHILNIAEFKYFLHDNDQVFSEAEILRCRWKQSKHLSDIFWSRWQKEYVAFLQLRQKWFKRRRNFAIGDVVLVAESGDGTHYVHFVERTSFWRFPDDVVVGLTALNEVTTQIELHSQSRLGQSDLGVNPDRLEGLHAALVA